MIILLNIPTAANVIVLAKFHSRDGCFNAGIIQFILYIIQLRYTTFCIEELLPSPCVRRHIKLGSQYTRWSVDQSDLEYGLLLNLYVSANP